MSDFRKLTVKYLQGLAKKRLGRGYSKWSKADLLRALRKWIPQSLLKTEKSSKSAPRARVAKKASSIPMAKDQPPSEKISLKATDLSAAKDRPAIESVTFVEEGFFELPASQRPEEKWNETAQSHLQRADLKGDFLVAMVRDPTSLYVFCAFEPDTVAAASTGIVAARPALRIYEGDGVVAQFYLRSNSGARYLHGLTPNRHYTIQLVVVGQQGEVNRTPLSYSIFLPRQESSPSSTVRMLHLPWLMPLKTLQTTGGSKVASRTMEGASRLAPVAKDQARSPLPSSNFSKSK